MKKRALQYMLSSDCSECHGKRLRRESLSVTFAGLDIAELSRLPLKRLAAIFAPYAAGTAADEAKQEAAHPEKVVVMQRIAEDLVGRLGVLLDLGLGYLSLDRSTPTLSPGELQRLRLATQVRSNLFGVVYVLDEPSAGLHPADTEALLTALDRLKASGNSLFVVEHELDVIRHADWIVDVGPAAGEHGGRILYSGPPAGLADVEASQTRRHLFGPQELPSRSPREPAGWLELTGITRNNLRGLDVAFPVGMFTSVTGVSGSGKSSLVSQALVELVAAHLGHEGGGRHRRARALHGCAGRGPGHGPRGCEAARARRPEVDRPHPALEPRHVHRAVRSRSQAVRVDEGRPCASLRRGPVLVQRGEGPVRELPGRRLRVRRDAVPAERLHAVPGVRRHSLQREDARDQIPRQLDRRCPRHDGRCGLRLLLRGARDPSRAARRARGRARLSPARPAGDRAVGRRGAADQARDGAAARAAG